MDLVFEHENEALRERIREIASLIPECSCLPAYKDRNLTDPNCCYHAWFEDIKQIVEGI